MLVAGAGRIGNNLLVRDRDLTFVGNGGDIEGGLVSGLVERRKRAARVRGLELRGGVLASLIVFAQIEAAHLVVENAGVGDVDGRRSGGQRLLDRQHDHFFFFLGRDFSFLRHFRRW